MASQILRMSKSVMAIWLGAFELRSLLNVVTVHMVSVQSAHLLPVSLQSMQMPYLSDDLVRNDLPHTVTGQLYPLWEVFEDSRA
jgi:hypothetical protein